MNRQLAWTDEAWKDWYSQSQDRKSLKRINKLIDAVKRDPFRGIGKPEALKHNLQGCYSRRINQEHRFVYRVKGDLVEVISVKYHYK